MPSSLCSIQTKRAHARQVKRAVVRAWRFEIWNSVRGSQFCTRLVILRILYEETQGVGGGAECERSGPIADAHAGCTRRSTLSPCVRARKLSEPRGQWKRTGSLSLYRRKRAEAQHQTDCLPHACCMGPAERNQDSGPQETHHVVFVRHCPGSPRGGVAGGLGCRLRMHVRRPVPVRGLQRQVVLVVELRLQLCQRQK